MRAIQPYAAILDIDTGVDVLKKIERAGRTCYKSTENIKEGSEEKFVAGLIERGHEAMLEHASFCFEIDSDLYLYMTDCIRHMSARYGFKSFMRFTLGERFLMSGNVRAWRSLFQHMNEWIGIPACFKGFIKENPILFPEYQDEHPLYTNRVRPLYTDDLKTEQEFLTHCDVTARFVVDRGISHELVRHRPASFAQESTRYCNYSKGKFDNQITYIIPYGFDYGSPAWKIWKDAMECAEAYYMTMINTGVTPEWARSVLPSSLKTEVIMTANCAEWKHFFALRACNSTGKAHPQMLEVSRPLLDEFKNIFNGIFDDLTYGE